MTVAAVPEARARRDPLGACLSDGRQDLNNARFAAAVAAAAALFAAVGLTAGDVLAVMLPDRVEFVTSMFAAWRLGAAVTPIDPATSWARVRRQIGDSAAAMIVADAASAAVVRGLGRPVIAAEAVTSAAGPDGPVPRSSTPDTLALVAYPGRTGGTAGVMLDQANIGATGERVAASFEMDDATRGLLGVPVGQVAAIMVGVVAPLLAGGSVVLGGAYGGMALATTVEWARPTYVYAAPRGYQGLVGRPVRPGSVEDLRYVICGAAMPGELIGLFEDRYGVPVVEMYGVAECTACCTTNPLYGLRKAGTVGLPLPDVDIAVAGPDGRLLPAGVAGEVVVRGPNVMRGYLGRPADSARTLRGGWLHSGDVGLFDPDGYLILLDRADRLAFGGGIGRPQRTAAF